jgi:DeoR/GlpR family transcriptional regulator of sugar metabolism
MFESSAKRVLLADHTKFERRALHHFATLHEFDAVVVDEDIPISHLSRMRSAGINVIVADAERAA